ncbi:hypothetical protein EVAR_17950_1 [Eumeta japonica]|uniref:FLYWCH-type domain-containing protein n=1 Tax=Eumeta variegata TaxID=151549 RepID=A0A4C1UYY2_EUMVA|nr:hypothetical protein EVAR_17950_1 [Eumeta japonica]
MSGGDHLLSGDLYARLPLDNAIKFIFCFILLHAICIMFVSTGLVYTVSKHGGPVIQLGGNRYCVQYRNNDRVTWRCYRQPRGCRARICTKDKEVIYIIDEHNH